MKWVRFARVAVLGTTLLAAPLAHAAPQPGAAALESRLYAPCCYGGTLDIHDSELARELRSEIEGRLSRGESSDAIQADFVARYGDRVVAARSDRPLRAIGFLVTALLALAAIGLGLLLRRWRGRDPGAKPVATREPSARDELDERIDAALAETD